MKGLLLRCRDANMMGPFCDYIPDPESFDESIRELHVHAKTHHEQDISDEEVSALRDMIARESVVIHSD